MFTDSSAAITPDSAYPFPHRLEMILAGDIPVSASFHAYMLAKANAKKPKQRPLFRLPPLPKKKSPTSDSGDIGTRPDDKSKHHRRKDIIDNARPTPFPTT